MKAIIIGGPTASGKSALAFALAKVVKGVIINADSQQLYRDFPLLTSCPDQDQLEQIPHKLYGCLDPLSNLSVAQWREWANEECQRAWRNGSIPIITGGSGLYLKVFLQGLSPIPPVSEMIRKEGRLLLDKMGNEGFYRLLTREDPLIASLLHPHNSQRLARAWEVMRATGRSLAEWQKDPCLDAFSGEKCVITVMPPRNSLYHSCDERFDHMIKRGAIEEVRHYVKDRGVDQDYSMIHILGFSQILDYLRGRLPIDQAKMQAQAATRHYAKRQVTWFKNQIISNKTISEKYSERIFDEILSFIKIFLLTC